MAATKLKPTNKVKSPIRLAASTKQAPAKAASLKPKAKPQPTTDSRLPVTRTRQGDSRAPVVKAAAPKPAPKPAAAPAKPGLLDQIGSFFGSRIDQITGKKPSNISQAMQNAPQWYQTPKKGK